MACSRDTNGDGNCGRPLCPECGLRRVPVVSSNIRTVGFMRVAPRGIGGAVVVDRGVLEVEFVNGSVHRYFDVPLVLHESLMKAESVGKFFHRAVRMGGFKSEQVKAKDPKETVDG